MIIVTGVHPSGTSAIGMTLEALGDGFRGSRRVLPSIHRHGAVIAELSSQKSAS